MYLKTNVLTVSDFTMIFNGEKGGKNERKMKERQYKFSLVTRFVFT